MPGLSLRGLGLFGLGFFCLAGGFFLLVEFAEEFVGEAGWAGTSFFFMEFGFGGDGAVVGVIDDLLDVLGGSGFGVLLREVQAGDLQAVEEEACAAWVDLAGGDALDDLTDAVLDGGAILGQWEGEGAVADFAGLAGFLLGPGDGFAGGVVVEAEEFLAEGGGATAAAVGVDAAALEAFGFGGVGVSHAVAPSLGWFGAKSWIG